MSLARASLESRLGLALLHNAAASPASRSPLLQFDRRCAQRIVDEYDAVPDGLPLKGVVVGAKDVFVVHELAPCRMGVADSVFESNSALAARMGELEAEEGCLVSAVRSKGGLFLAKTRMTEMCYMHKCGTVNPWDAALTPGGSSSGSAVAAALGWCDVTLGTQCNGSVTRPAAYCGVYGYKPTKDRVSRRGFAAFSPSVDQPGFFSRNLDTLQHFSSCVVPEFSSAAASSTHRLRVAQPAAAYTSLSATPVTSFADCRVPILEADRLDVVLAAHKALTEGEAARQWGAITSASGDGFSAEWRTMIVRGGSVGDDVLARSTESMRVFRERVEEEMASAGVDVLVCPATVEGGAPDSASPTTGNPTVCTPWSHSGHPTLCVPSGARSPSGAPIHAVQLVARFGRDEDLFVAARRLF